MWRSAGLVSAGGGGGGAFGAGLPPVRPSVEAAGRRAAPVAQPATAGPWRSRAPPRTVSAHPATGRKTSSRSSPRTSRSGTRRCRWRSPRRSPCAPSAAATPGRAPRTTCCSPAGRCRADGPNDVGADRPGAATRLFPDRIIGVIAQRAALVAVNQNNLPVYPGQDDQGADARRRRDRRNQRPILVRRRFRANRTRRRSCAGNNRDVWLPSSEIQFAPVGVIKSQSAPCLE